MPTLPGACGEADGRWSTSTKLAFDRECLGTVIGCIETTKRSSKRVLDDEGLREALMTLYATRAYRRARGDGEKVTPGRSSFRRSFSPTHAPTFTHGRTYHDGSVRASSAGGVVHAQGGDW